MKFKNKLEVSREEAKRKALFLRYGTETPSKKPRPPALLTVGEVAKLMHVDKRFVSYLFHTYFNGDTVDKRLSL